MREPDRSKLIPIDKCVKGRVYKIRCRNLRFGVFDGEDGFIGIRTKFSDRYLFTEYHWDQGAPFGTVMATEDIGVIVPEPIAVREGLCTIDLVTKRQLKFDKAVSAGGKGWYFVDNGERADESKPCRVPNKSLFWFLDLFEKEGEENNV